MKTKAITLGIAALLGMLVQGCISLPPIVQVEHKDNPNNQEIVHRLDRIDQRLDQLEQRSAQNAQK